MFQNSGAQAFGPSDWMSDMGVAVGPNPVGITAAAILRAWGCKKPLDSGDHSCPDS